MIGRYLQPKSITGCILCIFFLLLYASRKQLQQKPLFYLLTNLHLQPRMHCATEKTFALLSYSIMPLTSLTLTLLPLYHLKTQLIRKLLDSCRFAFISFNFHHTPMCCIRGLGHQPIKSNQSMAFSLTGFVHCAKELHKLGML